MLALAGDGPAIELQPQDCDHSVEWVVDARSRRIVRRPCRQCREAVAIPAAASPIAGGKA
jgi:hypothetical protein